MQLECTLSADRWQNTRSYNSRMCAWPTSLAETISGNRKAERLVMRGA